MLTDTEKKQFANRVDNIVEQIWLLMVDISKAYLHNRPTIENYKNGPISDLHYIYRKLVDIRENFTKELR